jgi:molybdopterin synthase catalytic subunit
MTETIQVAITEQPINAAVLLGRQPPRGHGAAVSFFGVVRELNLGRQVEAIEYEAFAPLAEKCFRDFCLEAKGIWGEGLAATIVHRVGRLAVGDISVAIIVSTPHRAEAYEASRAIIEQLKHRAPIWKKEYYSDGQSDWVRGHALCQHTQTSPTWQMAVAGVQPAEPEHGAKL